MIAIRTQLHGLALCAISWLAVIAFPAIAAADSQAPTTTIMSAHPAAPTVQVAGDKLFGDVTDDLSGVASVTVTFTPLVPIPGVYEPVVATAALGCSDPATCRWSADLPVTPGSYTANAFATDYAGNIELPGPSITLINAGHGALPMGPDQFPDPSDQPIQPGAPLVLHVGPSAGTPEGVCTMNFVFRDAQNTYIGTAGHCAILLGERSSAPEIGEFGTVVFRVASGLDDFALILVDADKLASVSPIMRGVGAAPTGFTTSDETAQGDLLTFHGWGIGFSAHPASRTRDGVLTDDDAKSYSAALPLSVNDSGAPIIRTADGKALGIANSGDGTGPTVERIMVLLEEGGFNVTLVTEANGTQSSDGAKSSGRPGAGALTPLLLLPLVLLALRRRMAVALPLLLALVASPANADPPYGDGFDAPSAFETAVLIGPNDPDSSYRGFLDFPMVGPDDIDVYRFAVSQGQDIAVTCTQLPFEGEVDSVRHPCVARLVDPSGNLQSSGISSDGFTTRLSITGASAGDWRLEVSGFDYGLASIGDRVFTYYFGVTLSPPSAGDAGGGAVTPLLLLPLALLALRRRMAAVPPLVLAAAAALFLPGPAAFADADPLADPSDKPIQPGAPKFVHGGTFNGPPWSDPPLSTVLHANLCTMNFVFKDTEHTYIGAAGHCALAVGARETAPDIGEFGTVVFRISCKLEQCEPDHPKADDFALIRIDADKLDMVSPVMRGVGAAPSGFTTSDETSAGDFLTSYGWGIPFSTLPTTRTQQSVLVDDDPGHFTSYLVVTTHSGSPVIRASDGKAIGIVTARYTNAVVEGLIGDSDIELTGGPTVERILILLADAGFNVTLVTQAGAADSSGAGPGAAAMAPMLLLPLILLALPVTQLRRRNRPSSSTCWK